MSLSCPENDRKKFVRRLGIDHRVFGIFTLTLKDELFFGLSPFRQRLGAATFGRNKNFGK
jgi:hypothetical protein